MPNSYKTNLLANLTARFGQLRKIAGSESLFTVGDDAARIYLRYSKIHSNGRAFFGLREVDLRQLEGHNSFLCFFVDDGPSPLFVPYVDFEEIFHNAESAKDDQYKVQLIEGIARELYIARQGRFNVEGYVGYDVIARSLDAKRLRPTMNFTHPQIQTLLGAIGRSKDYDVWIPACDMNSLDWSITGQFPVRKSIPRGFETVRDILSEIDVVWVAPGRDTITGLFEVEHSTPLYSGLLRFNDVLLAEPRLSRFAIVSNDERRALFSKQLRRPTFVRSGLSEITSFLEYPNVVDWHARVVKRAASNYD